MLNLAVFATSLLENERRVPIHPDHFRRLPEALRQHIFIEKGYGANFGFTDKELAPLVAGILERDALFEKADAMLLPKPVAGDFRKVTPGKIVWGWCHFVQGPEVTQIAIDNKITALTWEGMHHWNACDTNAMPQEQAGSPALAAPPEKAYVWGNHTFYLNNQTAGYAAVHHHLMLSGLDAIYGRKDRKCVVIGRGNAAIGAVYALHGRGFVDISVYSHQPPDVKDQFSKRVQTGEPTTHEGGGPPAKYFQVEHTDAVPGKSYNRTHVVKDQHGSGDGRLIIEDLAEADIIVNCVLQNPERPAMFVDKHEVPRLKPRCLVIDVSCDAGMGFVFAKPTSFEDPMFKVPLVADAMDDAALFKKLASDGETPCASYYSVDHTPSLLFDSATHDISEALLDHLPTFMEGPAAWRRDPTLSKAVEFETGVVKLPAILNFQKREKEYPHKKIE